LKESILSKLTLLNLSEKVTSKIKNIQADDSEVFREEFWRRCSYSNKPVFFKLYFLVAILICAGIGVLFSAANVFVLGFGENYINLISMFQNFTTYAIAITATSIVDFVISETDKKTGFAFNPFKSLFSLVLIFGFFLVLFSTVWTYFPINRILSSFLVLLGTGISLLTWWIANADNSKLLEIQPSINAATGGNTENIKGDESALKEGLD
jgi:hypothetical protein